MKISVYLNNHAFGHGHATWRDDYQPDRNHLDFLGQIEAETLEHAYFACQHGVKKSVFPDRRSISMGDVFETKEGCFLIQFVGFKRLDW